LTTSPGTSAKIDYYVPELNAKPYTYGEHLMPHDADSETMLGSIKASAESWG
jgi:hypothetical protein